MTSAMLAIDEVPSGPETYSASPRSASSTGKSKAEKGQSFADSPPLVKARAEQRPDAEAQTPDEKLAESQSGETGEVTTSEGAAMKKESLPATHSRRSNRGGSATTPEVQPKAQAAIVAGAVVLSVEQLQLAQPVSEQVAPLQAQTQPALVGAGQGEAAQMCQVTPAIPAQTPVLQIAAAELAQTGQPVSQSPSVTASTASVDVPKASLKAGSPDPATSATKGTETQAGVPAKGLVEVVGPTPQKAAAESGTIEPTAVKSATAEPATTRIAPAEAPPVNPVAIASSDKIDVAGKYQQPVSEPKHVPQAQSNPQMETETRSGQDFDGSPQAPPQSTAGVSRPAPMEGMATLFSVDKGGMPAAQNGPEPQVESAIAFSDTSLTATSNVSTPTTTAAAPEAAMLKNPSQDLAEQLGTVFRSGLARPDKQVTIRLQPPELGSVTVHIEEQGQQIKAVLEVSRAETGREIEQALPQVIRGLQEAGLQIRKFDVVVSDQLGKDAAGGSSSHDAWSQQQGSRSGASSNRQTGGSSGTGFTPLRSFARSAPVVSTQGGIDLLA